ncbi:hypothetical protein ACHAQA_007196 [Verticillium albo-atrum]
MRPSAALGLGLPLAVRGSSANPDTPDAAWQSRGPQSAWIIYSDPSAPSSQSSSHLNLVITPEAQTCTETPPTIAITNHPDATWTYACHEDDDTSETLHIHVGDSDLTVRYTIGPSGALEVLAVDGPFRPHTLSAPEEDPCTGFKCAVGEVVSSVKKVFTNVFRPCKETSVVDYIDVEMGQPDEADTVDSEESEEVADEHWDPVVQSIAQPGHKAEHPLVNTDDTTITTMVSTAGVPAPTSPASTSQTPTIALAISGIILTLFLIGLVRKACFPRSEREAARDARRETRWRARAARWANRRAAKEKRRAAVKLAVFNFINRVFRAGGPGDEEEKYEQQDATASCHRERITAFFKQIFVRRAQEEEEKDGEARRMTATDLEAQTFVVGSDTDSVRWPSRPASRSASRSASLSRSFSFMRDRDAESITLVGTEGSESGYAGSDSGDSDSGSERSEGSATMEMDLAALRDMAVRVGRVIGRARTISITASLPGYTTEDGGAVPPAYDEEAGAVADGPQHVARPSTDEKR